ncbi:MAG: hypothetical protein EXR72_13785 [Myxococcales bacterium]|nr:hypothetical protein [Myxococcales bacterium]
MLLIDARRGALALPLLSLLACAGCADLPEIPHQTCGNGALEPGEACDRTAPDRGAPESVARRVGRAAQSGQIR